MDDPNNIIKTSKMKKAISVLLVAFVVVLLIKTFLVEGLVVNGESMSPTVNSGEYIFINKLAYILGSPHRGDIVVVKPRTNIGAVVKRIVGMPNERLQIINGVVTIREGRKDNPIPVDELYLNGATTTEVGTTYIQLDPFEYFIFGDNWRVSIDSRELGPVDIYSIKGKPFLIFSFKTGKFGRI